MTNTVTATFATQGLARAALLDLEMAGFGPSQISVVSTDSTLGKSFGIVESTKASEGAATGGTIGGVLGAIAAGLAATGTLLIPGVNLVVYGTLVAAAAGAGVGAATGGLIGALVGAGIPEHEAKRYEEEVKKGAVLIAVEAKDSDQAKEVKEIFKGSQAENIAA